MHCLWLPNSLEKWWKNSSETSFLRDGYVEVTVANAMEELIKYLCGYIFEEWVDLEDGLEFGEEFLETQFTLYFNCDEK